jgi:threonine/homoserine/homoserine lactone efflux protein
MELTVENLLQAVVAGFVCGFVVSVPVGPVNLTVVNQALRKGFGPAFLVGLGAICAETFYATLMLAGHSTLLDHPSVVWAMRVLALVAMIALGVRSLRMKPEKIEASVATAERVDERWHHPRAFLLGFILTVSNVLLVVLWATLGAVLFAHDWVQPAWSSRAFCVAGVFGGGLLWFLLLAWFVSRAHRRVKPTVMTALVRVCGVIFLLFAGLLAWKLFLPHA